MAKRSRRSQRQIELIRGRRTVETGGVSRVTLPSPSPVAANARDDDSATIKIGFRLRRRSLKLVRGAGGELLAEADRPRASGAEAVPAGDRRRRATQLRRRRFGVAGAWQAVSERSLSKTSDRRSPRQEGRLPRVRRRADGRSRRRRSTGAPPWWKVRSAGLSCRTRPWKPAAEGSRALMSVGLDQRSLQVVPGVAGVASRISRGPDPSRQASSLGLLAGDGTTRMPEAIAIGVSRREGPGEELQAITPVE